jgi:mono/diheme cytochrome c family protein
MSLVILALTFIAIFTMYEIFWSKEKKFSIERLKKAHRINGGLFVLLYFVIAFICIDFVVKTNAVPSTRALLHAFFAVSVFVALGVKIIILSFYRKFYRKAKVLGVLVVFLTFGMVGTSGIYYLTVSEFGTKSAAPETVGQAKEAIHTASRFAVRTDAESIAKGKELYDSKCSFCHDAYSYLVGVGPGHKSILKNTLLPLSKRPATQDNIVKQLRSPYKDMPSFSYLSDDDVQNIIAFLNTL